MASTYSSLKIQLMTTGENSGSWGQVTNDNFQYALEQPIAKSGTVSFSGADVTLTYTNTNATQTFRNIRLVLSGAGSGDTSSLIVPAIEKTYIIQNGCSTAITVKNSTGTGVLVPASRTMWLYSTGTGVVNAVNHMSNLTLATPLDIGYGGTGGNTAANARTALDVPSRSGANATGTWAITANNASYLNGQLPSYYLPIGTICMWYGTAASIPTGWQLCNGSSATLQLPSPVTITTPNLINRVVVGAGGVYAAPTGAGPTYTTGGYIDSTQASGTMEYLALLYIIRVS